MNDVQKKSLALIVELAGVMDELSIAYCVADKLAWDCWVQGCFTGDYYGVALLVGSSDLERLCSHDMGPNRSFAVTRSSKDGPITMARYVADDTTLLYTASDQSIAGVFVTLLAVDETENGFLVRSVVRKTMTLGFNPLDSIGVSLFEGAKLKLPANPPKYLNALLGEKWRKDFSLGTAGPSYGVAVDLQTPHEEYIQRAVEAGSYDTSLRKYIRGFRKWQHNNIAKTRSRNDATTVKFRLVMARFKLCEEYLPYKKMLLDAWAEGRRDEVARALRDYITWIEFFYPKKLAPYFDEELFNLVVDVLSYQKWDGADKLSALVPQRHKDEPLSDVLAEYVLGN